jgi:two-component system, cell cycle sensor histidine kinase and response regulator CckA
MLENGAAPMELVVVDIVMPGLSGRELARTITQRYPGVRILFTSGFTDDEVVRRGLMEAGQPFIQKPWSSAELLQRVREQLDEQVDRSGWDQFTGVSGPSPDDAEASSPATLNEE